MKKNLFSLLIYFSAALFLFSCQEEAEVNPLTNNLEEGMVSLNLVNSLRQSTGTPIGARVASDEEFNPSCSTLPLFYTELSGGGNIGVTSQADIPGLGHRFRVRNPTLAPMLDVEISLAGGPVLFSGLSVPAESQLWIILPQKGTTITKWTNPDGTTGQLNRALNNEVQSCTDEDFNPFCSTLDIFATPYTSGSNVNTTSIHDIPGKGHRLRIMNPTQQAITNVSVRLAGGATLLTGLYIPAETALWVILSEKGTAITSWTNSDGSTGSNTKSLNNEVQNCEEPLCEFPDDYQHDVPSSFDVYFIGADGKEFKFENVGEGTDTYELPLQSYTIYVTNFSDYQNLPQYTDQLFMLGTSIVDFSNTSSATVTVLNPYSAVMVGITNQLSISTVPTLEGNALSNVGDWFLIYSLSDAGNTEDLMITDVRGDQRTLTENFNRNEQYRYVLCIDSDLTIVVEDVFVITNDMFVR
ncbi:hypothetical protein [Pararhodonellum marinum]|uniref:hypothetical protein n=1 Tax=Pararhodonellum marinum TaxID=2755358 RepID=UPI00189013F5|nr:hypothetical protein [Pararhodonellum marinum]